MYIKMVRINNRNMHFLQWCLAVMLIFVKTTELVRYMYEPTPVIVLMDSLVLSVKKEVKLSYVVSL